jgi:hypothetical protein
MAGCVSQNTDVMTVVYDSLPDYVSYLHQDDILSLVSVVVNDRKEIQGLG